MAHIEYIVLVLALLLVISIVWGTLKTGISPIMSSGKARQVMLDSIDPSRSGPFIDLGSGWGTLVVPLARSFPEQQVIGYELSFVPWLISLVRKYFLRLDNLTLYRKDFRKGDLTKATTLFCYLYPGGMDFLHEKLKQERKDDVLIVSTSATLSPCPPIHPRRRTSFRIYTIHPFTSMIGAQCRGANSQSQ